MGSILGSGRSPGGGHGNPLQYSCLENPMDRGTRWATVHGAAESDSVLLLNNNSIVLKHVIKADNNALEPEPGLKL